MRTHARGQLLRRRERVPSRGLWCGCFQLWGLVLNTRRCGSSFWRWGPCFQVTLSDIEFFIPSGCKWISLWGVSETYCEWQTHVDRLWIEGRFERAHRISSLNGQPKCLSRTLSSKFYKKNKWFQFCRIYMRRLCICFSLGLPVGWGLWGREGQPVQNSKWTKSIWIWLYADYAVCCSFVFNISQTFWILASLRGRGGGDDIWPLIPFLT